MTSTAMFDYPSQRSRLQIPYGPMLLDTCVVQNLKTVAEAVGNGMETDEDELLDRYEGSLGIELVALARLLAVYAQNGPPWVVSDFSLLEFGEHQGTKGGELRRWWHQWAEYFDGCLDDGWYPEIDVERLMVRDGHPDVSDNQLALAIEPPRSPLSDACVPPFPPFRNAGDRALIRAAMRAGIPFILTTDLKSFWNHRRALYPFGIEIWRPSDLWRTLAHDRALEVARWRSVLPSGTPAEASA